MQPSPEDVDYLLEAVNEFFGVELGHRRPDRRLRRRAAADLERRQPQVGRHLAQGRAVRDLERADHDHRRQADDLAADGEAGRRPARRARRPRRRRAGPRRSRSGADRPGVLPRVDGRRATTPTSVLAGRYGYAAERVLELAASRPELARADRPRPARPARRGAVRGAQSSRRAASATCCCGARASGCWRRASCSRPTARSPRRVARAMAPELGWDEHGSRARSSVRRRGARGGDPGRRIASKPRAKLTSMDELFEFCARMLGDRDAPGRAVARPPREAGGDDVLAASSPHARQAVPAQHEGEHRGGDAAGRGAERRAVGRRGRASSPPPRRGCRSASGRRSRCASSLRLSHEQIGAVLGIEPAAVAPLLARARLRLRAELRGAPVPQATAPSATGRCAPRPCARTASRSRPPTTTGCSITSGTASTAVARTRRCSRPRSAIAAGGWSTAAP